jgi:hypothetical protein
VLPVIPVVDSSAAQSSVISFSWNQDFKLIKKNFSVSMELSYAPWDLIVLIVEVIKWASIWETGLAQALTGQLWLWLGQF